MSKLDDVEVKISDAEGKIIKFLDPHAKILRIVAWLLVCTNAAGTFYFLMKGLPISSALAAASAIVIFWMLVKSRVVPVATP
jgi:hypothetical protein